MRRTIRTIKREGSQRLEEERANRHLRIITPNIKRKEKERDRSRERRHSHKSKDKDKDRERDKDRHRDRGDNKDKEKSRRHRHSSGDKDRSRRHRSRERQSREKDSNSKDDSSTKDEKKSEDRKRRHSGSRNEDRKRHIEEIKDEIKEGKEKKIVSDTELLDISIKFKGSSSEDSKSPLHASYDPSDSHSMLPLDILLPPLPPLPSGISELATLDNKSQENQDRSPATPPYPITHNDNDYDDEESMLSPATPPLPDDDDDDEDRLTPPPQSLPAQKALEDVQIPIWKGVINMPDVAKFSTAAFEVSGKALFFTGDVPSTVEVVGRISPDTVWTYIAQVKKSGSKEILVVRFQPSCEEEKVSYIALYSYLSSKKRYGVIGNCEKAVKDFYIVPLASHQPIPQVLLPLDGPGFEESRPHMLIGVIIRTKHKRVYDPISGTWTSLPEPLPYRSSQGEKDSVDERSYTPPPTSTPKPSSAKRKSSFGDDEDNEEVLEVLNLTPTPENADGTLDIPPTKEKTIDSAKSERESMLAELNRQIERDRKELSEMQKRADKKMEENEKKLEEKEDNTITIIDDNDQDSEVTSSDVGGPEGSQETFGNAPLDTSKINIPSNLHEILASIKEKEKAIAEKENEIKRRLNMPEETSDSLSSSSKDVDLRLLLGTGKDQDLRVFTSTGVPPGQSGDQDFRSREPRDPRIPRDNGVGALPSEKGGQSSLSSLSDADLVAKAVEMEVGPTFNPTDPGIHHMYEQRVPPEHPTSHGMMPPPGGPPPPHNMVYPPEPNPAPPNIPYPPHPMPPPGYRPQGPYMSGGPPPNGPPMGMPHGPPPPPFIHDHPQHPPGPPIPSGHPGPPPTDPACPPLYGPHRGSPSERMPVHGPYEEYPPYPQPRHVDDRRHHRMESGRHSQGGSWDSRRDHRDRDSNSFWSGEEGWDRRGDGNVRRGNMNKNYDRFPTDKKRRWKEGGGGGRPQHYRGRWGDDDNNEDWSGGDNRNWRNGGGKRPRRDRNWYDSTDRESGQKEIDY
ncbi:PHD finger protein 3 [Armadillidium nasatum]|uniref:PHD finger protein 3 n=1 Tax=Armadillidium nasatum TaxID=96803 RepID=A0A5N5TCU8_9CRUS|nr:PHD finger protein 3 [Armadillidium nasatum]